MAVICISTPLLFIIYMFLLPGSKKACLITLMLTIAAYTSIATINGLLFIILWTATWLPILLIAIFYMKISAVTVNTAQPVKSPKTLKNKNVVRRTVYSEDPTSRIYR